MADYRGGGGGDARARARQRAADASADSIGAYIDRIIRDTHPDRCRRDAYCADDCECACRAASAAADGAGVALRDGEPLDAAARNPYTVAYLADFPCCGDPGDCDCGAAAEREG